MKKILTVIGARPQFIKASVVSNALCRTSNLNEVLVHTGQHFDANMSEVFFSELAMIAPRYNLGIHGGPHGAMTGKMLEGIEAVLLKESPDAVLVYGDTNSTLAGALAAAKMHIPVAHIEAGLRSFNMRMPEEINRILTDRVSTWLFTPTDVAVSNLRAEGVNEQKIFPVGDVMCDAALHFGRHSGEGSQFLTRLGLERSGYVLVTIHRAENTDDPQRMEVIVDSLCLTAKVMPVVWPVHPRTRGVLRDRGLLNRLVVAGVLLEDPVGYLQMVQLEKHAAVVATDSGGVQKEAYFFGVPCVTLREETEWTELVAAGWNRLSPPLDAAEVSATILKSVGSQGQAVSCYGNGNSAELIADCLSRDLD
jgi:UDP-GlcNAc3NAcA epimerase